MKLFYCRFFDFYKFLIAIIFSLMMLYHSRAQNTLALAIGGPRNDQAYSLIQTSDGGYVMAGQVDSGGVAATRDGIITKISSAGVPQWTRIVGGSAEDYLRSVVQTFDGGFIAAGFTNSFGNAGDVYVVKLDSLGVVDWTRAVGTTVIDRGEQIIQTSDSGYAIAGTTGSGGSGDMYILKLRIDGSVDWDRKVGQVSNISDIGASITEAHGGGYVICGNTFFNTGTLSTSSTDFYAVKVSAIGAFVWGSVIRDPFQGIYGYDYGKHIIKTRDGGYVMTGELAMRNTSGGFNWKYGLVKLNGNGGIVWTRAFGSPTNDNNARRVIQTIDDGFAVIGGMSHPSLGLREQYLAKFDSNGDYEGNRTFGTTLYGDWLATPRTYPDGNEGFGIVQTADSGYAVAGYLTDNNTTDGLQDQEIHFVKFDAALHNCHAYATLGGQIAVGGTLASLGSSVSAGGTSRVVSDTRSSETWQVIDFCMVGINANISIQNIPCAGQCTGTAAVHPFAGTPPYSFTWNTVPPQYTDSVSGLCVGTYIVTVTDASASSATFTVTITAAPNAVASVGINASSTTICPGTLLTFTAAPTNGGSSPSYQWLLNSTPVGTNSLTYSNSSLNDGDTIRVIMTSNLPCATGSPALSNPIVITVTSALVASVTITASDTAICPGQSVTFSANGVNGGNNPSYQWRINNNPVGTNSPTFTTSSLNNGDVVTCIMTSDLSCVTGSPATSMIIVMSVGTTVEAGFIAAAPDIICSGETSLLSIAGASGGGIGQWQSSSTFSNFTNITGATQNTYTTPALTQSIFYRYYVSSGNCSDTTPPFEVVVKPLPLSPSLTAASTLICASDSTLICTPDTFNTYMWNTGATTSCIYARQAGGYWVSVTATNGCTVISGRKDISIHPVTSVSIVRQGDTLSSFNAVAYQWFRDGQPIVGATSPIYVATQPGTYSVQILDANGCYSISTGVVVTGLKEIPGAEEFRIYPNPAEDLIQIEISKMWIGKTMEIYDATGRLVHQQSMLQFHSPVNISSLSSGVYLIRINGYSHRFTKQ